MPLLLDAAPRVVDRANLPQLGLERLDVNPYRGNSIAVKTRSSAYTQDFARCHGSEAVSGGIVFDLRSLPPDDEGDAWFIYRTRNGAIREGVTYMPPFEGILTQEAIWAIRAWLITLPVDE